MASARNRLTAFLLLVTATACASAEDRLAEGVTLQAQGRYIEAVYRYIEAVEKDPTLVEAQDRLLAAGDSAVNQAMDDADELERRGDPVQAAGLYRQVDRMLAAARGVGMRIPVPQDYGAIRRAIFDTAINWQMVQGDEAAQDGRWSQARVFYIGARGDYLPSRDQVDESYDAEERLLLSWAEVELTDGRPRASYQLAQEALDLRPSPSRETVLKVRDLQDRALDAGTVVVAVAPVMADDGVREYLGGEFEIELDEALALDHWTNPPLFVEMADPLILRRELRGLLRGRLVQSPTVVGRALNLIGADLGVMINLDRIEVVEEHVDRDEHEGYLTRKVHAGPASEGGPGRGRGAEQGRGRARGRTGDPTDVEETVVDTVTYATVKGDLSYHVGAEIILVDPDGREIHRFEAESRQRGPFQRGEFDGDPRLLDLDDRRAPYFDPSVLADQVARIESAVLSDLAISIGVATYDQVLAGIR